MNLKYGVIFQCRFNDTSKLIKENIENGKLGKVISARVVLTWCKPDSYYSLSDWKGTWDKEGGGGMGGATSRSLSMPSQRTRILGVQLYYYKIEGFLHWGYNFYNSCLSYTEIDPYGYPDNGYFMPSGDGFLVYPGANGEAWESLRLNALREAMDDIRALRLYERKFGREATERLILEGTNGRLTFTEYPESKEYLINLREKIALSVGNDQ